MCCMKKIIGLLVLLLFVSGVSNATVAKKNKKKVINPIELKKDSVNADYKKVTKDAVSKKGLFTTFLSKKENNLYFEIPDSAFSHTYLLANRIAETSNSQDYVAGQMATTPLMIRFSKDDQKVYMHLVQSSNIVDRNDPILPAFDKNFADPVLKGFKIVARNMDNVVIDVTSFFGGNEKCISPIKQESPLAKLFGGGNSLKGTFASDASNILSVKTFPNNIEIKSLLSFTTTPLNQPYSVTVHRSLFVLPDTLMPMRLQDNRVGYFSSDKSLYTSSKDKIVPQTFIHRWRLEPQKEDLEKYFKGELVEPMKPIVFYVDTAFPEKWRTVVKQGIEDWNMAFQTAGFKNVVKALDYPSNDPNFDPDDMRYSCVKYAATSIANAMGPSYIDPRTGEILTADVIWYHNVISLLHNWRFVQTAAVDSRVRKAVFDDEVMQEAIRYAAAHEIGHTLGLMHNMGASYSFPVDSLRSPEFTQRYGTTPSIMDYARNNYIAQPGDLEKGVKLTPPILGVYDIHAINWGYRLIQGADTPEKEKKTLDAWIEEKKADPMYEFGAQQVFGVVDPTDQSEDLGNDHLKAGDMAIHNLKIIMKNLETWTFDEGARYDDVENMYIEVVRQYTRHLRHVMPYIGGIRFQEVRQGEDASAKNYIDKAMQKKAMLWLLNQARTYNDWLTPKELIVKLDVNMNVNDKLQSSVVGALLNSAALYRINEGGQMNPKINYTLNAYLDDAFSEMFKPTYQGVKLSQADMNIQSAAVALMINYTGLGKVAEKKASTALADYEEVLRQTCEPALPCSHVHGHESSFTRINFGLPTLSKEQLAAVMTGRLNKIAQLYKSRRAASTGDTRDFYDYQLLLIERTLKNN